VKLPPHIQLRAAAPEDKEFLRSLYATTREFEMSHTPWDENTRRAFLSEQFELQYRHYASTYPGGEHDIILLDGVPIGRWYIERNSDHILVIDVTILPECRRGGLGESIVRALQDEAAATGKRLFGSVERWNPAWRLWQRIGFRIIADDGVFYRVEWRP